MTNSTVSFDNPVSRVIEDPVLEPRVESGVDLPRLPEVILAPRVQLPIMEKTVLRPTPEEGQITRSKAVADALKRGRVCGRQRSKYAQAVEHMLDRGRRDRGRYNARQSRQQFFQEFAQAVLNDNPKSAVEFANEIFDADSGKMLKYRQLITHPEHKEVWYHSSANEFGRLAQGVGGRIQGTDTIFFIHKYQVPADRWKDVTYAKFVCELKPNKAEVHRTRLTVGGDKVHYPGDVGTPTADLTLVKMHVNSVITTPGTRYMTLEVKNFYLNTPMERYKYVRIKLDNIPEEIIVEYNFAFKSYQRWICFC